MITIGGTVRPPSTRTNQNAGKFSIPHFTTSPSNIRGIDAVSIPDCFTATSRINNTPLHFSGDLKRKPSPLTYISLLALTIAGIAGAQPATQTIRNTLGIGHSASALETDEVHPTDFPLPEPIATNKGSNIPVLLNVTPAPAATATPVPTATPIPVAKGIPGFMDNYQARQSILGNCYILSVLDKFSDLQNAKKYLESMIFQATDEQGQPLPGVYQVKFPPHPNFPQFTEADRTFTVDSAQISTAIVEPGSHPGASIFATAWAKYRIRMLEAQNLPLPQFPNFPFPDGTVRDLTPEEAVLGDPARFCTNYTCPPGFTPGFWEDQVLLDFTGRQPYVYYVPMDQISAQANPNANNYVGTDMPQTSGELVQHITQNRDEYFTTLAIMGRNSPDHPPRTGDLGFTEGNLLLPHSYSLEFQDNGNPTLSNPYDTNRPVHSSWDYLSQNYWFYITVLPFPDTEPS